MRLFTVGHHLTISRIKRYVAEHHRDVLLSSCDYEVSNVKDMKNQIQRAQLECDAILFTGQMPYDVMLEYVTPSVPWDYVVRKEHQLLIALLQASIVKGYDICSISFDMPSIMSFPKNTLENVYSRIGLSSSQFNHVYINENIFDKDLMDKLTARHEYNYNILKKSFCLTAFSPVYELLCEKKIPVIRIEVDDDAISESINRLRLSMAEEDNSTLVQMSIISISSCDERYEGIDKQRVNIRNNLAIADEILSLCNRVDGALLNFGVNSYGIISHFLKPTEEYRWYDIFMPLLKSATLLNLDLCIGVGISKKPRLALLFARASLARAEKHGNTSVYVCESQNRIVGPIVAGSSNADCISADYFHGDMILNMSRNAGVSANVIERLVSVRKHYENEEFTSHDIARELSISIRNANRIIDLLEKGRVLKLIGTRVSQKGGRPLRIFKLEI